MTPADDLVWTKHEDDVMTAVQCSGRLTLKVFSSGKINLAIQSAPGMADPIMDNNPINWNNSMLVDKVAGEEATPTEQFNPMY